MIAPASLFRAFILASTLTLGGCAGIAAVQQTQRAEAEGNVAPRNPRGDIVALMKTYLNDPTQVRGAYISEPEVRDVGRGQRRYALCLRYNARTSEGRYAGSKDSLVIFWHGRLDRIVDNARDQCRSAVYQPFPQLETMTR